MKICVELPLCLQESTILTVKTETSNNMSLRRRNMYLSPRAEYVLTKFQLNEISFIDSDALTNIDVNIPNKNDASWK